MKGFVFTPIHTVPIDEIKRISVDESERVNIHTESHVLYVWPRDYTPKMSVKGIYNDIQRQLLGDA